MVSSPPVTVARAEELVRLMTDGLVNIVDKTGEFLLKRKGHRHGRRHATFALQTS